MYTQTHKSENAMGINLPGINLTRLCKLYMNKTNLLKDERSI